MYKRIIVADDEAVQRNGLRNIIQKIYPETEVLTAPNGSAVLELLKKRPAELILTDIRMPAMDGLELLRILSEKHSSCRVILISAYQDFEYAKTALKYHAIDYLVKPFRVSDVQKLLEKVWKELEAEHRKAQLLSEYDRLSDDSRRQAETERLRRLLRGSLSCKEQAALPQAEQLKTLGIAVCIQCERGGTLQADWMEALCRQSVQSFSQALVIPLDTLRAALLVPGISAATAAQGLLHWVDTARRRWNLHLCCGISLTARSLLEEAPLAFLQAEEALAFAFYGTEGDILLYEKYYSALERPFPSLARTRKVLLDALLSGDEEALRRELDAAEALLRKPPLFFPLKTRHQISSMVVSILNSLEGSLPHPLMDTLQNHAYEKYNVCDSLKKLFSSSLELLLECLHMQSSLQETKPYDSIDACIAYIDSHLDEELSLNDVASRFHFNSNYLSGQIKSRTGSSYTAYLLSRRMEYSRRLLSTTEIKVQEIARRAGFRDCSYFIRLFRRENGVSPEQYRRQYNRW